MATANTFLFALGVVLFVAALVATFVIIGMNAGSNDNKAEVAAAIRTVSIANAALILLLGFITYTYVRSNPMVLQPYLLFMIHVNLLLSLVAVSITSIVQMGPPPTKA